MFALVAAVEVEEGVSGSYIETDKILVEEVEAD